VLALLAGAFFLTGVLALLAGVFFLTGVCGPESEVAGPNTLLAGVCKDRVVERWR